VLTYKILYAIFITYKNLYALFKITEIDILKKKQ